jgi:hypothetical protein
VPGTRLEVVPSTSDFATPRRDEAGGHLNLERISRTSGAATVVAGAYYLPRESIQFQAQIIEAPSGHVIRALVANIYQAHSVHPQVLTAHLELYRELMFGHSELTRAEREGVALAVSAPNGCRY